MNSGYDIKVRISTDAPAQCKSLVDYTNAFDGVNDLLDMLVDIRNGLVHSSPNKMKRILRPSGSEERTELWFQIVFLLQQAVLATIDYRGDIIWSNRVANFVHDAIGPVPWIQTKKTAV